MAAVRTTNHIAEAAGVSTRSLYQCFSDKDAAVGTCAERWAHSRDHCRRGPPTEADDKLVRVLFGEAPFTWSLPGVQAAAMVAALDVVEQLDSLSAVAADQRRVLVLVVM